MRLTSATLAVILAGLPLAGIGCALLCASGLSDSAHTMGGSADRGSEHTVNRNCNEPPAAGVQFRGPAGQDCGGTVVQAPSFAAYRADAHVRIEPAAPVSIDARLRVRVSAEPASFYERPPGTDPPTATPLVLRV
jgi:hypothetical protein